MEVLIFVVRQSKIFPATLAVAQKKYLIKIVVLYVNSPISFTLVSSRNELF